MKQRKSTYLCIQFFYPRLSYFMNILLISVYLLKKSKQMLVYELSGDTRNFQVGSCPLNLLLLWFKDNFLSGRKTTASSAWKSVTPHSKSNFYLAHSFRFTLLLVKQLQLVGRYSFFLLFQERIILYQYLINVMTLLHRVLDSDHYFSQRWLLYQIYIYGE